MRRAVTPDKLRRFLERIGQEVRGEGRIFLSGGASALLHGWRPTTVDIDFGLNPEPKGIFDVLPRLKEELDVNLELASPEQFVPPLPGWEGRSEFIGQFGVITAYHFDFYTQALSKIERYFLSAACSSISA